MKPAGLLFISIILGTLLPFQGFSQQTNFKLGITDSLGKPVPANHPVTDLRYLHLDFNRGKDDQNEYEVFVFGVNEKGKLVRRLVPASYSTRNLSTIDEKDSTRSMDLLTWNRAPGDSIKLVVFIATGFNFFYSTFNDLTDTATFKYSWLQPKRDSLYNSFTRLMNSDLDALPSLAELESLAAIKSDNLLAVEQDLEIATSTRKNKICFKQVIGFNSQPAANKLLTSYNIIQPAKSYLALSWSEPRGFLFKPGQKSAMDDMIAGAAEKHLKLMNSRGVEPKATDHLKYTLKELVQTLEQWPDKVGLLLYALDPKGLQIMYADNSRRIDTILIPLKKDRLNELANQLQLLLVPGSAGNKKENSRGLGGTALTRPGTLDSLARVISHLLLPAKFKLESLDHLVLIPSFNIATFPFAMLPVKDSMLLIDKMSYSIVPSINEFIITGQVRKKHFDNMSRSKFNIKGDSVYWSYNRPFLFVGSTPANKIGKYNFAYLPGTKLEIETLSKKVSSPVILMDKNAVKSKVKNAVKDADVIYFATHAIADTEDPLNKSFILLSGKNDSAMLTAKEIQQLDLHASLVVLSACETGLGKSHEGGMIGLSRAFGIAGAKNVLMSLWPVSDSKTPTLMKYFFDALENNGNGHVFFPHEAFRQAVLKFKKEQKDPVYWAAFSLFGLPL